MDHIEPSLLSDPDILVVGAPGCNANAVAEYVMIWLDHLRRDPSSPLGIIGFGNVGQRLARYAIARGHRVLVNDPPLADIGYTFPRLVSYVSLDDLLEQSSIVSIHTPLITHGVYQTFGLLHAERIAQLQYGSLLFNTARGGIIDERALCNRIDMGELQAVLDVFTDEPAIHADTVNIITACTPHVAGYSEAAKYQGARMVSQELQAHFELNLTIPDLDSLLTRKTSLEEDHMLVTAHPFRSQWLRSPSPSTFEMCRRLTSLRAEHTQPPTWEELNGHRA
jgi:erythronate-4-phosphate dehydrogenase